MNSPEVADTPESRRISIEEVNSVIDNWPLASDICRSIRTGLSCSFVHLDGGNSVEDVFQTSLKVAVRDIEHHSLGQLFRRLIEFGPHNHDEPEALTSDGKTVLSDPECGQCVEFIFSHMVNRFKGELAELLAIAPCVELVQRLVIDGRLPSEIQLYWGGLIQERCVRKKKEPRNEDRWSQFLKGADGLLVEHVEGTHGTSAQVRLHGVFEVKSMVLPRSRLLKQIEQHISRFRGGLRLGTKEWSGERIQSTVCERFMVRPSTWKLSREWNWETTDSGKTMVFPEKADPPTSNEFDELGAGEWSISLAWSDEAIEEAAYNMTFGYMGDVGDHVYSNTPLPNSWKEMTAQQGGFNAIKMMLYYMMLRPLSKRHDRLATKLYNVYCFGYPLGVDSREMLWPQDFPKEVDDDL